MFELPYIDDEREASKAKEALYATVPALELPSLSALFIYNPLPTPVGSVAELPVRT